MDAASEHMVVAFEALAQVEHNLRSFGYKLYLETKARSWIQPRGLAFCRKGHAPGLPALIMGFAIHRDATGERAVVFSVLIAWDATHWSVQSFVEDEDGTREVITDELWQSQEYTASTLAELFKSVEDSVAALMSSARDGRVAAMLDSITRRP